MTPADWMLGYCNGDPAAFRALYGACAPRLLGYLKKLCGDGAMANDLLQITFLKVHQGRDLYVRGADPLPWLYTIARRTFIDAHRGQQRARIESQDQGQALPEIAVGLRGQRLDEEAVERFEGPSSDELRRAVATLPAAQRQAVVLTKLEGRSVSEAAAVLGTTPGAVKLRAHRAYQSLRKRLRRHVEGAGAA